MLSESNNSLKISHIEKLNAFLIFLIFLLSLGFLICFANSLGALLKPWIEYLLNILEPDFHSKLSISESKTFHQFHLEAVTQKDLYRYSIPIAPTGSFLSADISILHAISPCVLIFTLFLIQSKNLLNGLVQFLLACMMSVLLISLTTPFLLAYHLEIQCLSWAENFTHQRFSEQRLYEVWIIRWTELMELGGQWLLAILLPLTIWIIMRATWIIMRAVKK